jgi:hypothetical protein
MIVEQPRDPSAVAEQITTANYAWSVHNKRMRSTFPQPLVLSTCLFFSGKGIPVVIMFDAPFLGTGKVSPSSKRMMPEDDPSTLVTEIINTGADVTSISAGGLTVVLDRHGVAYVSRVSTEGIEYFRCGQGEGLTVLIDSFF